MIAASTWSEHFEADMWISDEGRFSFDPSKLEYAHAKCQAACSEALKLGVSVVVSNTFTRVWEMEAYLKMAEEFSAQLTVIEVQSNHENIHGCPSGTIKKMRDRWEDYRL